jgi:hypothetical protein
VLQGEDEQRQGADFVGPQDEEDCEDEGWEVGTVARGHRALEISDDDDVVMVMKTFHRGEEKNLCIFVCLLLSL